MAGSRVWYIIPSFLKMIGASLIQVKGKKRSVTFNSRNPEFRGYRAIGDVMAGDTVAAKYTEDGIISTKLKGTAGEKKAEKTKKALKKKVVSWTSSTGTGPCMVSVDRRTVEDYKLKVINKSKEGGSGIATNTPAGISCSTGSYTGCEDFFHWLEACVKMPRYWRLRGNHRPQANHNVCIH